MQLLDNLALRDTILDIRIMINFLPYNKCSLYNRNLLIFQTQYDLKQKEIIEIKFRLTFKTKKRLSKVFNNYCNNDICGLINKLYYKPASIYY